ncbi:MAG: hypothetical protein HOG73_08850 [Candidatus Marinimicrobia bacterium]|nr:hypothetical protein [Candidatus Neomarinimicrobiota bacterium]
MNKKRPLINSIFAMVTVTLVLLNSGLIMAGDLPQQEETFYLKSGDKVSGTITVETDDTYVVSTSFGSVTIKKADIIPKKVVGFQASLESIDYYQMGYDQADKDIKTGDWDIDNAISAGAGLTITFFGIPYFIDRIRGVNVPENIEVSQNGKSEYESGYEKRIQERRFKTSTITACSIPVIVVLLLMAMAPGVG